MSYNKARAEKEWLRWKNNEEQQLREMGVSEDIIQRLHTYDWEQFKSDRRYYEKAENLDEYIDTLFAKEEQAVIATVEDLMENIDNEQVFSITHKSERRTLEIVLYKMAGYSTHDISEHLQMSENAVKLRLWKFKKNFKKFLK